MSYILLLLLIVIYIYAVFAVNLYQGSAQSPLLTDRYRDYFDSIGTSMMSLFQILTLDEWDNINRSYAAVAVNAALSNVFILSWVFLGAFIFRNIFVGVMGGSFWYLKDCGYWLLTNFDNSFLTFSKIVNNFDKISTNLKEKRAEYMKAKKFERMRKRLNKELAVQGTIQKSLYVLFEMNARNNSWLKH